MKTIVCVPLLLAVTVASPGQSQTFAVAASVIDPQPGGIAYEKAIDYFTATNYPSYFLGTDVGAFLYDTVKHLKITVSYTGSITSGRSRFIFLATRTRASSLPWTILWRGTRIRRMRTAEMPRGHGASLSLIPTRVATIYTSLISTATAKRMSRALGQLC
jgi:hypothetical protein